MPGSLKVRLKGVSVRPATCVALLKLQSGFATRMTLCCPRANLKTCAFSEVSDPHLDDLENPPCSDVEAAARYKAILKTRLVP